MKSQATDGPLVPGQAPIKTRRFSFSLVWIVPIVAVLVGISLVVHSILQEGPTITVKFKTGDGLTANKTEVKYRNVVIGHVSDVELANDQKSVNATIKLAKQAESFTRKDSQFWVVRPRIGAGGVSGIDTLLSGDYIGADIGQDNARASHHLWRAGQAFHPAHPGPGVTGYWLAGLLPQDSGRPGRGLRPGSRWQRGEHRTIHPRPQ
jgi:paraquat-inducible protein B